MMKVLEEATRNEETPESKQIRYVTYYGPCDLVRVLRKKFLPLPYCSTAP